MSSLPPREGVPEGPPGILAGGNAKIGMIFAVSVGAIGLAVAYALWLHRGCVLTPFISDLTLREPESRVFRTTCVTIVPIIALIVGAALSRLLVDLRKAGKSMALWLVMAGAGVVLLAGIGMAGLTAWDQQLKVHVTGAAAFFLGSCVFVSALLGVWTQLGQRRPGAPAEGPVKWVQCALVVGVVAAAAGLCLFILYGPVPPCQPGVEPVDGNCIPGNRQEGFFDQLCYGDAWAHSSFGGNATAVLEWLVFGCIVFSLIALVAHDSTKDAAPLLG